MPQSRLVGGSLHGHGQKCSIVTFQMAFEDYDHMTCCAHSLAPWPLNPASSIRDALFILLELTGNNPISRPDPS